MNGSYKNKSWERDEFTNKECAIIEKNGAQRNVVHSVCSQWIHLKFLGGFLKLQRIQKAEKSVTIFCYTQSHCGLPGYW